MNVYIQHRTSSSLYSDRGWVKSILEADAFENTIAALNHCLREGLRDVQIRVASASECGHDTIFSVTHFPERTKAPAMI
jgi:hypothetical protein